MTDHPTSPKHPQTDRATAKQPVSWIKALATVTALAVLIPVVLWLRSTGDELAVAPPEPQAQAPRVFTPPVRPSRSEAPPAGLPSDEVIEPVPAPPVPVAPVDAEGPVGVHAFPPLGTRPKLSGIVVPEDFELPPGYVRHFQTSDDGEPLAPILMFDPSQVPLDPSGQPIAVPPDRIVPPELAPPGMPIDLLELPEPREPASSELRRLLRSG